MPVCCRPFVRLLKSVLGLSSDDPILVVADEPTSDLDVENTEIILDYFQRQQQKGKTILISTHDLSCLRPGVTHYTMEKGVLQCQGVLS